LKAARARFPGRRLWALLEPRSNTLRRNIFETQLGDALALADCVVVADVYRKEKISGTQRLDPLKVLESLRQRGIAADMGGSASEIVAAILPRFQPGDVVIVMSNGGFGGIHQLLLQGLGRSKTG
jgi:UDP-N-acetylmuramate: L-alanyl-gamma-D-glutamyl-meso-diaminopimelate ligase